MTATTNTTRPRGRPKGSGIDDRGVLAQLVNELAAEPRLKPTTALKRLGVTDPSTLRRLRDKYRLAPPPPQASTSIKRRPPKAAPLAPQRSVPLATPPEAKRQNPQSEAHFQGPAPTPPPAADDPRIAEAFLKAFLASGPVTPKPHAAQPKTDPAPQPQPDPRATQPPPHQPDPHRQQRSTTPPPQPPWPFAWPFPGANPQTPMPNPMAMMSQMLGAMPGMGATSGMPLSIPPMPVMPWLPFGQPPPAQAAADPAVARQMQAMKLAIEAMTSIAKLQLHVVENAAAYSPLSAMLQGQAMLGQMLTAALTGMVPKPPKSGSGSA